MQFLADTMLGKLVRWLRLIGVRAVYAKEVGLEDDDELVKHALKHKLVFLTRDEKLAEKAVGYVPTLLIKSNDYGEQVKEVARAFKLKVPKREVQTLCPLCGSGLARVPKASVKKKVWPRVYKRSKLFWRCTRCKQIYWRGTHVREIRRILSSLSK